MEEKNIEEIKIDLDLLWKECFDSELNFTVEQMNFISLKIAEIKRRIVSRLVPPVILFFALIMLVPIKAQTIELKKNIVDSVKYGEQMIVKGAYDIDAKKILIQQDYYDYTLMKIFLHELGHHIWFNGGVDTTAILNDLAGNYLTTAEVKELFAEQHWKYFFGDASPAFHNIFEAFYNRDKSKK